MNIILCGAPLSGKTTVGLPCAEHLGWNFIDTDRLLEKKFRDRNQISLSCREIYRYAGEMRFRELEKKTIESLDASEKCVIAIGGGVLLSKHNASILKKIGTLIYMRAPLHILLERFSQSPTPSYLDGSENPAETYKMMMVKRFPLYEFYADHVIDVEHLSVSEIILAISENIHGK